MLVSFNPTIARPAFGEKFDRSKVNIVADCFGVPFEEYEKLKKAKAAKQAAKAARKTAQKSGGFFSKILKKIK